MPSASRVDMCQALVPVPADISIHSTDEELLRFLEGRKIGDPTPDNVIPDVDPSSVEPWNFPEGLLFLYNAEGSSHPKGECETKVTRSGYWRQIDDLKISTGACTSGRKILLEFYEGKAPFGKRTAWMMHEYVAEQQMLNGSNYSKDHCFLYRVFQQTDRRESQGKQSNSSNAGESVGEYINRMLLNILEQEDRTVNNSEIVAENEQEPSALSSREPDESVSDNSALNINCDFANEDYLEQLNDLYSPDTHVGSDNSSLMSMSDEEYFDYGSLLTEIANDHETGVKEAKTNTGFSICPPARSNKVLIGPSLPGSIDNNDVVAVEVGNPASWLVSIELTSPPRNCSASNDLQQNGTASSASRSQRDEVGHTANISHRQISKGNGSSSIRKIAKIGKRCFCFGSF